MRIAHIKFFYCINRVKKKSLVFVQGIFSDFSCFLSEADPDACCGN